jgi:hypothetical protein
MQKPKKFLAVSCSHGHHINRDAAEKVLKFRDEYKPHKVLHLGDAIDADCFRAGAMRDGGGGDIIADLRYGLEFVERLAPTTLFLGNHEDRLYRLLNESKNELVLYAASDVCNKIEVLVKDLKAELVPYSGVGSTECWRLLGGTAFGHGVMYNEQAARDHAEMLGRPVVFGHVHKILRQAGRCPGAPEGVSVGCLADIPAMAYAKSRRATASWDLGFAFGEYTDTWCKVYTERIDQWQPAKIKQAK